LNQAITPGARFEPAPAPWSIPSSMESSLSHHVEADLYGHILRISEIWQKVATYIGAGGRNSDRRPPWLIESTFALLANELLIFDVTLPVQFRYNDSNLIAHSLVNQGRHYGLLHLLFYTSTLVLHRDYLPFLPTVDFDVSSLPCMNYKRCQWLTYRPAPYLLLRSKTDQLMVHLSMANFKCHRIGGVAAWTVR
jgi:hypothetical protein